MHVSCSTEQLSRHARDASSLVLVHVAFECLLWLMEGMGECNFYNHIASMIIGILITY